MTRSRRKTFKVPQPLSQTLKKKRPKKRYVEDSEEEWETEKERLAEGPSITDTVAADDSEGDDSEDSGAEDDSEDSGAGDDSKDSGARDDSEEDGSEEDDSEEDDSEEDDNEEDDEEDDSGTG